MWQHLCLIDKTSSRQFHHHFNYTNPNPVISKQLATVGREGVAEPWGGKLKRGRGEGGDSPAREGERPQCYLCDHTSV